MNEKQISLKTFNMLSVIGKGSYAKVILVRKKAQDSKLYALKILKKKYLQKQKQVSQVMIERNVLSKLDHPFIVKMYHSFQDNTKLYFVLEFCQGGELFNLLQKKSRFSQEQAKFFAAQIVLAIEYLHSFGIVYRDLKPENILIDQFGYIRLTDFGLSNFNSNTEESSEVCGTAEYLAPEMLLKQGHGKAIDWWCLGCLICEMIIGMPPFYCKSVKEMLRRIKYQEPCFPPSSVSLRKLLEGLFKKNPSQRLGSINGASDIKSHPWFQNIDWRALTEFKIKPPFIPVLEKDDDLRNFSPEFTECRIESACSSPLKEEQDRAYEGFSFNNSPLSEAQRLEGETNSEFHIKIEGNEESI